MSTGTRARQAILGLTTSVLATGAMGAAWEFNPSVEIGYLYDDNYFLSPDGTEVEVDGGLLDAQLELCTLTHQGEFSFTPRVRATYFPDASEVDSRDYFADLDWQRRGQRVQTRVRADYSQQDVANSELPDAELILDDLGETLFGDSGLIIVRNRRTRASVRPSLSYELSPRKELQFEASYADVQFDNQLAGAQVGYRQAQLSAGLLARTTEASSITTRLIGARYDIDTLGDSNAYGAELQWDTRTAGGTRAFLRGGAQQTELVGGDKETTWLAGAGVSVLLGGRNELFSDISRSVGPTSAGQLITRDQLRVRFTHTFSPRISLLAGVRGSRDEGLDEAAAFAERAYVASDLGLQWRIQEELSLRVSYDYAWQDYEAVNAEFDAASSGASLTLLYQPQRRR